MLTWLYDEHPSVDVIVDVPRGWGLVVAQQMLPPLAVPGRSDPDQ